jgi:hypothetical protein
LESVKKAKSEIISDSANQQPESWKMKVETGRWKLQGFPAVYM